MTFARNECAGAMMGANGMCRVFPLLLSLLSMEPPWHWTLTGGPWWRAAVGGAFSLFSIFTHSRSFLSPVSFLLLPLNVPLRPSRKKTFGVSNLVNWFIRRIGHSARSDNCVCICLSICCCTCCLSYRLSTVQDRVFQGIGPITEIDSSTCRQCLPDTVALAKLPVRFRVVPLVDVHGRRCIPTLVAMRLSAKSDSVCVLAPTLIIRYRLGCASCFGIALPNKIEEGKQLAKECNSGESMYCAFHTVQCTCWLTLGADSLMELVSILPVDWCNNLVRFLFKHNSFRDGLK